METYIILALFKIPEFVIVLGVYFIIKRILFLKNSNVTMGKVTGIETDEMILPTVGADSNNRRVLYIPKIEYSDSQGKTYRLIVGLSARFLSMNTGEEIAVRYHCKNPRTAFVNNIYIIWVIPLIISVIGIGLFVVKLKYY